MFWGRKKNSSEALKNRLQLVLSYDRAQMAPGKVEALKNDLLAVIEKYFPKSTTLRRPEVQLEQQDEKMVLVASIPLDNN